MQHHMNEIRDGQQPHEALGAGVEDGGGLHTVLQQGCKGFAQRQGRV